MNSPRSYPSSLICNPFGNLFRENELDDESDDMREEPTDASLNDRHSHTVNKAEQRHNPTPINITISEQPPITQKQQHNGKHEEARLKGKRSKRGKTQRKEKQRRQDSKEREAKEERLKGKRSKGGKTQRKEKQRRKDSKEREAKEARLKGKRSKGGRPKAMPF